MHDVEGHPHPGPEHDATQTSTRIKTDEDAEGYYFLGSRDSYRIAVEPVLFGENPWDRKKIW